MTDPAMPPPAVERDVLLKTEPGALDYRIESDQFKDKTPDGWRALLRAVFRFIVLWITHGLTLILLVLAEVLAELSRSPPIIICNRQPFIKTDFAFAKRLQEPVQQGDTVRVDQGAPHLGIVLDALQQAVTGEPFVRLQVLSNEVCLKEELASRGAEPRSGCWVLTARTVVAPASFIGARFVSSAQHPFSVATADVRFVQHGGGLKRRRKDNIPQPAHQLASMSALEARSMGVLLLCRSLKARLSATKPKERATCIVKPFPQRIHAALLGRWAKPRK